MRHETSEGNRYNEALDAILTDKGLISHPVLRYATEKKILPLRLLSRCVNRFEGGPWFSKALRYVLGTEYGVLAGAYSYGSLLIPGSASPGLIVGRYVSIASGVVWGSDHPKDTLSTHPIFYLPSFGLVEKSPLPAKVLEIGHDAWIGTNVVITTKCQRIGIGAIVGAGSILTKDVPDFAIVTGVPARVIRHRFPSDLQETILASQWWVHDPKTVVARYGDVSSQRLVEHPMFSAHAAGTAI
jgi:virginiamycin A acetyltransferase